VADLEFLGHLSAHITSCSRCGVRWDDGGMPLEMLEWALRRSSLKDIIKAVELEQQSG
jgi:hypothetical protein